MKVPVRLRLVVGFGLVVTVLLTALGLIAYARLDDGIRQDLDAELRQRAQDLDSLATTTGRPLDRVRTRGYVERGESFAEILDPGGRVLDATSTLGGRSLLTLDEAHRGSRTTYSVTVPQAPGLDEPARLLVTPIVVRGHRAAFVVGVTEGNGIETLDRVRRQLWIGIPLLALVTTLGAYVLIGVALGPVERMRARAASMSAVSPGSRLPVPPGRDEFARLGATLNDLLARLEDASVRQRMFVAHASHELRTPLAMMALELELAVRRDRTSEELRGSIASARDEVHRLTTLAEDLLLLSRTEEGTPAHDEVDLTDLVARVAARAADEIDAGHRCVRVLPSPARYVVRGDAAALERALSNLVANAVHHGAGDVEVSVVRESGSVVVRVRDTQGVLAPEVEHRAFDRFTRGGRTGRSGVGLPIVAAIAAAHAGTAGIAARRHGGVDSWLRLPDFPGATRTSPVALRAGSDASPRDLGEPTPGGAGGTTP